MSCRLSAFCFFEFLGQYLPDPDAESGRQFKSLLVGQQDKHIVRAVQQNRALAALLQVGLKQTPYAWRHVVIEIIRDLPANLFAPQGDHGCAFPDPRCLTQERETKKSRAMSRARNS